MKRTLDLLVLICLLFTLAGVCLADSIPPVPPAPADTVTHSVNWLASAWDIIKSFISGGPMAAIGVILTILAGILRFTVWGPKLLKALEYGAALEKVLTFLRDVAKAGSDGKFTPEETKQLWTEILAIVSAFKPDTADAGRRATVDNLIESIQPKIPTTMNPGRSISGPGSPFGGM